MRRSIALVAITVLALTLTLTSTAAAGGGGCIWESSKMTEAAGADDQISLTIDDCRYEPTTLYIEPGTTVTWTNEDMYAHSVTGAFLTINGDKLLNEGDTASATFDDEGVFPYYCVLHPGMAASVVVGDPDESMSGVLGPKGPSGTYDSDAAVKGSSESETTGSTSVPIAAGVAVITVTGLAAAMFLVRKRRRAELPVPGTFS